MSVLSQLAGLESAGLIRVVATDPEVEYLFRHALVQDAAYRSLLQEDRRALHMAVAEVLEHDRSDGLDTIAATLAHHYARAGVPEKAIGYFERAAARARALFANVEAIDLYRAALDELEVLERTDPQLEVELREALADVLKLVGRFADALAVYGQALASVPSDDVIARARILGKTAGVYTLQRKHPEALAAFAAAEMALGAPPEDDAAEWWRARIDLLLDRSWVHYFANDLAGLTEMMPRTTEAVERHGTLAQRARFLAVRASAALRKNRMRPTPESLADIRLANSLIDDPKCDASLPERAFIHFGLAFILLSNEELDEAERQLIRSLEESRRAGDIVLESRCLAYLLLITRRQHRLAENADYARQASEVARRAGMTEYLALCAANLAWLAYYTSDPVRARTESVEAERLFAALPMVHPFEWLFRLPMLAIAVEAGDFAAARKQAEAMCRETQQRLPDSIEKELVAALASETAGDPWPHLAAAMREARRLTYI